jgi:hypothetical protein
VDGTVQHDHQRMLVRLTSGLILVATAVLLTGCVEVMGPSGPSGPPPDPMGAEIVSLRESGARKADRALAQATRLLGGEVLGRASNDRCWEGQRNWKVDDGYDYRCALRRVVVVGVDGDFRKLIARFDRRLFAAGWECGRYGSSCESNSFLANDYWEMRRAERIPGQPYPVWKLPTKSDGYARGDLDLLVDYAGTVRHSTFALESATHMFYGFPFHEDDRPLDVAAVVADGKPYPALVVVVTEIDYFTHE